MYQSKEMAGKLGVSVSALQRWDREKTFIAKRNPKGRRYYAENQYLNYIGLSNEHNRNFAQNLIPKLLCLMSKNHRLNKNLLKA